MSHIHGRLTRRQVLLAAIAGSAAFRVAGPSLPDTPSGAGDVCSRLQAIYSRESAVAVGHAYLADHPDESNAAVLMHHLTTGGRATEQLSQLDEGRLQGWLGDAVRDDFAADRIVPVQGWLLSVTEARVCALAALA